MIRTESVTYGTRECIRTYSDIGMKIMRDGIAYDEAVDPVGTDRTYTETDEPVTAMEFASETEEKAYAYDILVGGVT